MLTLLKIIITLGLASRSWAQCGPIIFRRTASVANVVVTASSGTQVAVQSAATGRANSCGVARATTGGVAQAAGGTIAVAGLQTLQTRSTIYATGTVLGGQMGLVLASAAQVTVQPSATAIISASLATILVGGRDGPATATLQTANSVTITLDGGGSIAMPSATGPVSVRNFAGTFSVDMPVVQVDATFEATGSLATGTVRCTQCRIVAASGAYITAAASGVRALAISTGTVNVQGASNPTVTVSAIFGGVATLSGTAGGLLSAFNGGTGYVTGSVTGSALGGGTVYIGSRALGVAGNGGTVYASSGALYTVQSGGRAVASSVASGTVSNSGTVTMFEGATAVAQSLATLLPASQGIVIEPVSTVDTLTYFVARTQVSGLRRRGDVPVETGSSRCAPGLHFCPTLDGQRRCVNVKEDIFNCGGCTFSGKGVDCTEENNGMVACIAGRCVIQEASEVVY